MSRPLEERLADLLPVEAIGRWSRATDGESFPLVMPDTADGFQAVMQLATTDGLTVQPLGRGTKVGWGRPAPELDLVLSTRRFTGILDYEPAEGTLTARAGTTLAALNEAVTAGSHHLAPAVPRPDAVTLGGVIAAGQNGLDRLRYGPVRNQLLGSRVLLADGRVAGSGGRLVKNVTGYDLSRLWCGSHGTLGVVLEASLRLYPMPDARAVGLVRTANRGDALDLCVQLRDLPVDFVGILAHDLDETQKDQPWTVLFLLAGDEGLVDWEVERIATVAPAAQVAQGADAQQITDAVRDLEVTTDGFPTCAITCRPSLLEENLVELNHCAGESGLAPRTLMHPGLARILLWLDSADGRESPSWPERLLAFHQRASALPVRVQWTAAPVLLLDRIDPFGAPTAGLPLMRRLRDALDPTGRFARGRFHAEL